ncbi:MAG: trypsin-like peptidase domain-containing protein [Microbacterium sp.]
MQRRAVIACAGAGLALVGVLAVGLPTAQAVYAVSAASTTTAAEPPGTGFDQGGRGGSGYGQGSGEGSGSTGYGPGSGSTDQDAVTSTVAEATEASAAESTGVVIIETVLGYEDSAAAGTGIVLTASGLVLTNNHVIEGSTEISVTIATTGETYSATVVGTDAADDVAVLQLEDASGLTTATIDDEGDASEGDDVTAVGNADGGGVLMAADGEITALDQTVTTSSEGVVATETLDGMIEFAADVVAGDSGGALLDDEGEVIGVTTAASSGTAATVAYAIPIEDALAIADQIVSGTGTADITIGYPAFLGVQLAGSSTGEARGGGSQRGATTTTSGATIAGVIDDTPAAQAGLSAGDTITELDGTEVTDASSLADILADYAPGDTVTVTWTDSAGAEHTASVTLIAGPAD